MTYFTLDDVKSLAREDGYPVDSKPYSYADDQLLKQYLFFKYQISEDFRKIKSCILTKSKSILDPDVAYVLPRPPRVNSYTPIICKIRAGLMLGKSEEVEFSSSVPLYTFDGTKYTKAPSKVLLNYKKRYCTVALHVVPEDADGIWLKTKSEHLDEMLVLSNILPLKPVAKPGNADTKLDSDNSIIGSLVLGQAILQ